MSKDWLWMRVTKFEKRMIENSIDFFDFLKDQKKIGNEYYYGVDIKNDRGISIVLNRLLDELPDKLKWVTVDNKFQQIAINQKNPKILGYAFGTLSQFDFSNQNRSILEYLERMCSFFNGIESKKNLIIKDKKLFDSIYFGFGWGWPSKNEFPVVEKWIKAKSLKSNNIILVPYSLVYYGAIDVDDDFLLGSSNGVAIGNGLDDAIARSLAEFIERDLLIERWLRRGDGLLKITDRLEMVNEFNVDLPYFEDVEIFVVDITLSGLYTVWVKVTTNDDHIYTSSGFSSNRNFDLAVQHAFSEAIGSIHVQLNSESINKSQDRLQEIQKYYFDKNNKNKIDVLSEKANLFDRYEDILMVDMTLPEIENTGLACTKVICIGGNNLFFDYELNNPEFPKFLPIA